MRLHTEFQKIPRPILTNALLLKVLNWPMGFLEPKRGSFNHEETNYKFCENVHKIDWVLVIVGHVIKTFILL